MTESTGLNPEDFTPEHYQAIGEFVVQYSILESFFHAAFRCYSKIPDDVCRALIGGMRVKDVIERTKRVMKLNSVDEFVIKKIEDAEKEFDEITAFRNKLVHRVWLPDQAGPILINLLGAKSQSAVVEEVVTTEEITQCATKIMKLTFFLMINVVKKEDIVASYTEVMKQASPSEQKVLREILAMGRTKGSEG